MVVLCNLFNVAKVEFTFPSSALPLLAVPPLSLPPHPNTPTTPQHSHPITDTLSTLHPTVNPSTPAPNTLTPRAPTFSTPTPTANTHSLRLFTSFCPTLSNHRKPFELLLRKEAKITVPHLTVNLSPLYFANCFSHRHNYATFKHRKSKINLKKDLEKL